MDQERKFGVEIECMIPYVNESENDTIWNLTCAFAKVGCLFSLRNSAWRYHADSSIKGYGKMFPLEIVSPILKGSKGLEEVVKVVKLIHDLGGKVNPSCGLHVHVDARNFNKMQLIAVAKRYEQYWHPITAWMTEDRSVNNYCKKFHVPEVASDFDMFFSDRYRAVNLAAWSHHGTIEFRQHHATLNPKRVTAWIEFCVDFVTTTLAGRNTYACRWRSGEESLALGKKIVSQLIEMLKEAAASEHSLEQFNFASSADALIVQDILDTEASYDRPFPVAQDATVWFKYYMPVPSNEDPTLYSWCKMPLDKKSASLLAARLQDNFAYHAHEASKTEFYRLQLFFQVEVELLPLSEGISPSVLHTLQTES